MREISDELKEYREDYEKVGKDRPLVDAKDKVTGKARYVSDVELPGMLTAKALRSPYPHAKVLNIDKSKAEKVPGVKSILTPEDVEQQKWGPITQDRNLLSRKARFTGDEIGLVVAVDEAACDEALSKIKVDYEQLPPVLDMLEAMDEDAPTIHEEFPNNVNHHVEVERVSEEEMERIFDEAYLVCEDEFVTNRVHQSYMEPNGVVAEQDENGYLTMYAGAQSPTWCRRDYAESLKMPVDKTKVVQTLYGGGFGAKIEPQFPPLGALGAKYVGQPVKLLLNRKEDFESALPRVPMTIRLKTAWSKEGELLAKDVYVIADQGAYADYGLAIAKTAMKRIDTLYQLENVRAVSDVVYTNKVPTGCFRGFGNSQSHIALENQVDEAAEKLGIAPDELRLKNCARPGYDNPHGWEVNSCEVDQCIEEATQQSNFKEKRDEYKGAQKDNAKIKRGIGLSASMHVSGNRSFLKAFDGASALLRMNEDGRLYIYSNEPDMGQGIRTVTTVCAAEVLDMPIEDIRVPEVDTDVVPFGTGCWASRGTYLASSAVKEAALKLKRKLLAKAGEMMNISAEQLKVKDGTVVWKRDENRKRTFKEIAWQYVCENSGEMLMAQGSFMPDVEYPDEDGYGNVSGGYAYACNVAEVEINTETGEINVTDIWAAYDVGQPINPMAVKGQICGGVGMGFGWAILEDMKYDEDGVLMNPNFLDYQIPTTKDIPNIHPIIADSYEWTSGYGAKSIGENALNPVAPAISNAIYNAIGVRFKEVPITSEKVLEKLQEEDAAVEKEGNQ
ncbi:xanthine dehydrogenase family protein molybdopterin-binding subunit [Acetohalobium arabaticum]|uniref:Aldehyde oxidase and xanthine dehydrogenase molybdopterin binding protein n=1 Tax=Acetohalobium arabaticum (strain ATCC 49924 / DSM 5501 / Z-7288) TaxID=574087 RepID=D9QUU5_ACEAZ|nr:molybdopterin cofactor-binding domain-containing protein [Acetohalobium arabaticum]ADL12004.1 aldehyde oxidase and xanthine dehydrogenase molybdopterin binding protein [Acetohalobium arabaticum DSM 5501]